MDEQGDAIVPALEIRESDRTQSSHRRDVAGILLFRVRPRADRGTALRGRLLAAEAQPDEVDAIRRALAAHRAEAGVDALRRVLRNPAAEPAARLRAACALQGIAPGPADRPDLEAAAPAIAEALLAEPRRAFPDWLDLLGSAADVLARPLGEICRVPGRDTVSRTAAAEALAELLARGPTDFPLAVAIVESAPAAGQIIIREVAGRGLSDEARDFLRAVLCEKVADPRDDGRKEELAARQSAAALALASLGEPGSLWPLLGHHPDPRLRTLLIQRLAADGRFSRLLVERLSAPRLDPIECQALLLTWAESQRETATPAARAAVLKAARQLFEHHAHPGVHAAAWLLLRRWQDAEFRALSDRLASARWVGPDGWGWEHGPRGQIFAIIPGPQVFRMGAPEDECARFPTPVAPKDQRVHHRRIDRSLLVSMTEVTLEQIRAFDGDHRQAPEAGDAADSPANRVDWFQAVRYCNWLSREAGIDPGQWCYPEPTEEGVSVPGDAIEKEGFRLPTEAEWEYICRAGTETARYYGESQDWLPRHAWTLLDPGNRPHPVGRLLPNEFGMFDILGNVWEWCHDGPAGAFESRSAGARMPPYPPGTPESPAPDDPGPQEVRKQDRDTTWRMLRGGTFDNSPVRARSAHRDWIGATDLFPNIGFRVVRTLPRPRGGGSPHAAASRPDAGPAVAFAASQ